MPANCCQSNLEMSAFQQLRNVHYQIDNKILLLKLKSVVCGRGVGRLFTTCPCFFHRLFFYIKLFSAVLSFLFFHIDHARDDSGSVCALDIADLPFDLFLLR